jgi:predicted MFS family arabinose efflux permease
MQIFFTVFSGAAMMIASMGIGRFAYTPLLPQMQIELGWRLSQAGDVASANYLGYLVGALIAALLSQSQARSYALMIGLLGSAFTTLWGALLSGASFPAISLLGSSAINLNATLSPTALLWSWMTLRFLSGVGSAFCLVIGTPILMERLEQLKLPKTSLLHNSHFAAVGVGIILSVAILSLVPPSAQSTLPALARHWALLGVSSCFLMMFPLYFLVGSAKREDRARRSRERSSSKITQTHPHRQALSTQKFAVPRALIHLIIAYGLMGFGYVVTATFIVAMARQINIPGLEPWTWVAVGLAGTPSIFLWQRIALRFSIMAALRWAYLMLIAGVLCAGFAKSIPLVMLGAVLLGGTFMAITSMSLQVARELAGEHSGIAMGWMTAAFGLGQFLGPAISGRLAQSAGDFLWPSLLAAALLLISVWLSGSGSGPQNFKSIVP